MKNDQNSTEYEKKWQDGLHLSNSYVEVLDKTVNYYESLVASLSTADQIIETSMEAYLKPLEYNFKEYEPAITIDLSDVNDAVKNIKEKISGTDGSSGIKDKATDDYLTYSIRIDFLIDKIEAIIRQTNEELITQNGEIDWAAFWANSALQDEVMNKIYKESNVDAKGLLKYLDDEALKYLKSLKKELEEYSISEDDIDKYYAQGGIGNVISQIIIPKIESMVEGKIVNKSLKFGLNRLKNNKSFKKLMDDFDLGDTTKGVLKNLGLGIATNVIINAVTKGKIDLGNDILSAGKGLLTNTIINSALSFVGISNPPLALSFVLTTAVGWGVDKVHYTFTHVDGIPNKFEPFDVEEYIEENKVKEEMVNINGKEVPLYNAIPILKAMGYTDKEAIYETYCLSAENEGLKNAILENYGQDNSDINLDVEAYMQARTNDYGFSSEAEYEDYLTNVAMFPPEDAKKMAPLMKEYVENAQGRTNLEPYDFYENCQNGDVVGERTVYVADSAETFSDVASSHPNDECVIVVPKGTEVQWDEGWSTLGHDFDTSEGNVYLCWDPNATSNGGAFRQVNESGGYIGDETYSLEGFNNNAGIYKV